MDRAATRNVILIGMPGVDKSTLGVLLAKVTSRDFLDTDVYIQARGAATRGASNLRWIGPSAARGWIELSCFRPSSVPMGTWVDRPSWTE